MAKQRRTGRQLIANSCPDIANAVQPIVGQRVVLWQANDLLRLNMRQLPVNRLLITQHKIERGQQTLIFRLLRLMSLQRGIEQIKGALKAKIVVVVIATDNGLG